MHPELKLSEDLSLLVRKNTLVDYIKLGAACVFCWQLLIFWKGVQ